MAEVLAKTDDWLVLNKPAGWLTIPGRGSALEAPIVSEWARREFGEIWVVHRLDRETSGVILFARTASAHRRANTWFSRHEVKKLYHCIAEGSPSAPVLRINEPIENRPAQTQIEVEERFPSAFLARVRPITGRRHQIRIHLAHRGFPILGDALYGGKSEPPFSRVALHASRLELPSGEKFEAPFPSDFRGWLDLLRREAKSDE